MHIFDYITIGIALALAVSLIAAYAFGMIWSLVCGQTPWRGHPTNRRAGDCLYLHSTGTFQGNWRYSGPGRFRVSWLSRAWFS